MAEIFISGEKYHQLTHFPVVVKFQRREKPDSEIIHSAKQLRQTRAELTIRENAGECSFIGYYRLDEEIH